MKMVSTNISTSNSAVIASTKPGQMTASPPLPPLRRDNAMRYPRPIVPRDNCRIAPVNAAESERKSEMLS